MKALTIQQPWAHAIIFLGKDVENRAWPTKIRGRILIHAGKTYSRYANDWFKLNNMEIPTNLPAGGIIGSVEIVDCVQDYYLKSKWFFGKYGFVLRNPIALPFTPCRGQLGFFEVALSGELKAAMDSLHGLR